MNMTRDWFSLALACALGAFIGTLTALEISVRFEYGSYLWIIGALVGGVVAYVAVDFRHFCAGVVCSYYRTIAWHPDSRWWKTFAVLSGGIVMMYLLTVGVISFLIICFLDKLASPIIPQLCGGVFGMVFAMESIVGFGTMLELMDVNETDRDRERKLCDIDKVGWVMIFYFSPIGVTLLVFRGLKWVVMRVPLAITCAISAVISSIRYAWHMFAQFAVEVFVYVHSQRRVICFVDASIGAAIGYSFGSAIIGAIAGAFLGVLNYEIVSVRLLKIVPSS